MRHLSEGTLRRIYDEPLALAAADQEHFDACQECRSRFDSIANNARAASSWLNQPVLEPQSVLALAALQHKLREREARPASWYQRWLDRNSMRMRPLATPAIALAMAAVLVGSAVVTGVSTQFIRVFQPTRVVAVSVSPSSIDRTNLRLDYGELKWLPAPPQPQLLSDAATARTQSGLPVLMPASLPNGVTGSVTYGVVPQATASLTFDAARLRASAQKAGVTVGPMPANINGSSLIVTAGPALVEAWGASALSGGIGVPTLVIAQTRVPTVDSTGASAQQLEDYLLSQPGVPTDLAAEIKAIKDPTTTLPIPIPTGFATTQQVQVDGTPGLLIRAAVAAWVVWVKNGVIYAVGGQLTPDQVLAIATSLH